MTAGEKLGAWLIGVSVAVTRFAALSKTPWDSDEGRFISALRGYDVVAHHPHPPGFPLFVAFAKLLTLIGISGFHALQLLSLVASIAIVPAMIAAGTRFGIAPRTTLIAAALVSFFPNVWYFGGTAFSDVVSMTFSLVVIAVLLRGRLIEGGVLLGIAAAIRPQTLLIAAVPALVAVWRERKWGRAFAFAAIVAAIVLTSYGTAAHLSGGWPRYRQSLIDHEDYIATHDSFRAPLRPPMWELFDNFFLRPYDAKVINVIVSALLAIGGIAALVRRDKPLLLALATFGPFCLAAWALLDRFSTSRFSIGYAPLVAFFAAHGLAVIFSRRLEAIAATVVVAIMIVWTWPALRVVNDTVSPPFAAAQWIREHHATAYVADEMGPIFDALLPDVPHADLPPGSPPLTALMRAGDVYVREGASSAPGSIVFQRERGRLAAIARSTRYFEVSIVPIASAIDFPEGWYPPEKTWRWMGKRARIVLPPHLERMRIDLSLYVPLDALPAPPNVTITFNGAVIDRVHGNVEKSYDVTARTNAPNELVIETDETVNPAVRGLGGDTRDLGVRLNEISWSSR